MRKSADKTLTFEGFEGGGNRSFSTYISKSSSQIKAPSKRPERGYAGNPQNPRKVGQAIRQKRISCCRTAPEACVVAEIDEVSTYTEGNTVFCRFWCSKHGAYYWRWLHRDLVAERTAPC